MPSSPTDTGHTKCLGCPLAGDAGRETGRRDFLRAALAIAASVGVSMLDPRIARAMPLRHGSQGVTERRYAIPATDSVNVDHDESVIIARAAGRAYAFSLSCPHQNTALRWEAADGEFRCPKHKSRYRPDGGFIDGRATRAMDRLAIRRDGDTLVVDVDTLYRQDEQAAQWTAAFVSL